MATTFVDQISGSGPAPSPVDPITGAGETLAYKAPCRLATSGNITLSGHQTIDGSLTIDNDRILVRAQTNPVENGIYIAVAGAWSRARDFDSNRDVAKGTRVSVTDGTLYASTSWQTMSANPIAVGTASITFASTAAADLSTALNATNKASPVNADRVFGSDSAASFGLVYYTWTQIKAFLKTYFDTLYQPLLATLTSWGAIPRASGLDTFATTPTSANLKALVTDETGSGALVFANSPALVTPTGIVKGDVGLGSVDNTSDANKPVSTAQQTALNLKANLAGPTFTGVPAAPTAAVDTNTTQLATTAMVLAQAAAATPLGAAPTAVVGASTRFARADHVHPGREVLAANRIYYVRSDGSDSNTGLTNTAGGAFATLNKARDAILTLDLNGYLVTIKIGNTATLTGGLDFSSPPVGGNVVLEGDTTTESNTVVSTTSANAVSVRCPMKLTVQNVTVQTTTSGNGLYVQGAGARVDIGTKARFGACAQAHVRVEDGGLVVNNAANYTIAGGAQAHFSANINGIVDVQSSTVTLSGTPVFSGSFVKADNVSSISAYSMTYSGAATGSRYQALANASISTYGGGASYFPGNSVGTTSTGGLYA